MNKRHGQFQSDLFDSIFVFYYRVLQQLINLDGC